MGDEIRISCKHYDLFDDCFNYRNSIASVNANCLTIDNFDTNPILKFCSNKGSISDKKNEEENEKDIEKLMNVLKKIDLP